MIAPYECLDDQGKSFDTRVELHTKYCFLNNCDYKVFAKMLKSIFSYAKNFDIEFDIDLFF